MFCKNCHASNEDDARYCIHCGATLSAVRRVMLLFRKRWFDAALSLNRVPLLSSLFDVSFKQGFSIKIIRLIYGLSILSAVLVALLSIIAGFYSSSLFGIFMLLIGGPLLLLLIVLYSRIVLEVILFHFRTDPETKTEEQPASTEGIEWNV